MMNARPFDNLPPLSKSDALRILKTPIKDLALSSDYYKAVFHLSKYYCSESEKALLDLVKSESKETSVLLAKRKAIEVLGRMKCKKAIPYIGKTLKSSDPFTVENSAWALQELGCNNIDFQNLIGSLTLPITWEANKMLEISFLNGISFLPNKQGKDQGGEGKFYGNNVFTGAGLVWRPINNLSLLSSHCSCDEFKCGDSQLSKL